MKTKRLQLMIMATLFLGVNIGGASVAQGATLQNKNVVVTKKPTPKSTVSTINVSKVNSTKKSTFRPLVTKPAPKPVAKTTSKSTATPTVAKSSAKPLSAVKPSTAAKPATTVKTSSVATHTTTAKSTAAAKPASTAPKPVAKPATTGVKSTAQRSATSKQTTPKVVKTTEADSIQANTAAITRNKVGSVVTPATTRVENVPNVRVLLGSRSSDATVTSTANMVVLNSGNGQVSTISANRGTTIGVRGGKIAINGKAIDTVVTLKPTNSNAPFLFEGKGYRGGLTLRANNGKMMVINSVPLEDYLYGVVPQEVVPSWPAAALEAQAVAARTYALHTMEENKGKLYDVSTTTDHQVYNGTSGETQATTNAVNKTKGMVMLYNQRPINALFHSDGGGYTEDSVNVWGSDVPYLKGVKDFSTGTSTSNWTVTTSRQALESKLNAASKGVGKLKSIQLTPLGKPGQQTSDRGVSGRIKSATFIGTSGKTTVDGDSLRSILGLKSTLFDFYVNHNPAKDTGKAYHNFTGNNDTVYIKGHGWGHGLGMSQWGAAEMAKRATPGDTNYYQTILRHYYSGITLKKMY
ncbi:SpoIID/LytB domain-containing protein [Veillonella infantium]|uniref:Sporulation protein SpoIID n=1 Tax=Veillonella infantium TaxID=1911679 RepID=A0ABX5C1H4_9FIRM|nr:SpoIID/LytB domain-containing protein [Veillonella infantium]PQL57241.1 sporulation protein SpoIID [Veillonella infantium]